MNRARPMAARLKIGTFVLRHGFLTLKMRTASFLPCIMHEKSDAGSAFSTVSQLTVNGTNMCYSLCYKRPLTDIDFFFASIIDPLQKWLPLNYSFVLIQISLTNIDLDIKILKNLLS